MRLSEWKEREAPFSSCEVWRNLVLLLRKRMTFSKDTSSADDAFSVSVENLDVEEIVRAVKERVEKKKAAGVYDRYNLVGVTKLEVSQAKSEEDFLRYHLKALRKSWEIDIGDFEIPSKGGLLGRPAVWLKKAIWFLLKFYTFRLFTQQRDFNLQVVNTLQALNAKIEKLSQQLKAAASPEVSERERQGEP
jgi:hypothetical protein